jgi:hypothetical protein
MITPDSTGDAPPAWPHRAHELPGKGNFLADDPRSQFEGHISLHYPAHMRCLEPVGGVELAEILAQAPQQRDRKQCARQSRQRQRERDPGQDPPCWKGVKQIASP